MNGRGAMENFRGTAPDHGQPAGSGPFLELPDIVHQHLGMVHLGTLRLLIGAVDALHVLAVEDGRHGLDRRERLFAALEQRPFEHAGIHRRVVTVFLENIPAAEHQVFERGQGHEVFDLRRVVIGALAQADGVQLRDGSDRLRQSLLDGFHAGNEGCGDRAHAGNQDAEFSVGWFDFRAFRVCERRLRCGQKV